MTDDDIELGRRAALYLRLEALRHCECHAWWAPVLMFLSRDYARLAADMNRQIQ